MNSFERLAKSINVKMGEKWLANNGLYYRINNKSIEFYNEYIDSWQEHLDDYKQILLGEIYPTKPIELGDLYYYIDFTSKIGISSKIYKNDDIDKNIFRRKMNFRNLEQADKKLIQLLSK